MIETSDARNAEVKAVHLSIGQCKLIERLLDEKLAEVEAGISDFNEKGLKTLMDVFWAVTKETDSEKVVRMEKWIRGNYTQGCKDKGCNHG